VRWPSLGSGSLEGSVALVTGASRGIGRAIALRLAADGAAVAVNYLSNAAAAAATVDAVRAAGGTAESFGFDVADPEAVRAGVAAVAERFGAVDVLVNNAGRSHDALLLRLRDEDWAAVLGTNLGGVFHCTRAVARVMVRARKGCIVNVTSVVGEMGNGGQSAYAAAKAGVIGFTKAVARELAPRGITVNAVSPGLVEAGMTDGMDEALRATYRAVIPLGREGTSMEVADAVAYLAGPGARYVTGQVLRVNGGLYM